MSESIFTEVTVFPVDEGNLRAYASVLLGGCFVVRDLKVIQRSTGELFVAMPSKKMKDGTFKDLAHPVNQETRAVLQGRVLAEYVRLPGIAGDRLAAISP